MCSKESNFFDKNPSAVCFAIFGMSFLIEAEGVGLYLLLNSGHTYKNTPQSYVLCCMNCYKLLAGPFLT